MRKIDQLVIHCADTPDDSATKFTVDDIDQWHRANGWHRGPSFVAKFNPTLKAIGYHYVIYRDGTVHTGRSEEEIGSHVKDHNATSLGICLIGQKHFTPAQWVALNSLLTKLQMAHPGTVIKGHYQYDTAKEQGKTCPNFDVPAYVAAGKQPAEAWIYRA